MQLFTRLIPVLPVRDVRAERTFYEALGFRRYDDPREPYPEGVFAALEAGPSIRFGVSIASDFDPATAGSRLWWQFGTNDADAVHARAARAGLAVEQAPKVESWGRRTLKLRSPNGYLVTFEEGG
jgi:catechol 2,3-dioxygenase-like lactoylglutathione lyase family enzyme